VALDRQSIEKKDFPVADGGYDRAAVDAHLSALASEVEELNRTPAGQRGSLAAAASERIRAIVEGAETTAAEIRREAEEHARQVRAQAGDVVAAARERADEVAHEHLVRVRESTSQTVARLDGMQGELRSLSEALRSGSERLKAELAQLHGGFGEVRQAAVAAGHQPVAAADLQQAQEPAHEEVAPADLQPAQEPAHETEPAPDAVPEPAPEAEPTPDDNEAARLIALNMALNGTPREETDRYLAEHYRLNDRGGLLDEIYASVEG
jgi:hypothetical protein